jgi:hypothetical protein
MRKLMLALLAAIVIVSCNKETAEERRDPLIEVDDFKPAGGFNKTKRSADYGQVMSKRNINAQGGRKDTDRDGIINSLDNCPSAANPDQLDSDEDGTGDVCDLTPFPPEPPTVADTVIMLDFNGHYVDGTLWNTNGPFTAAAANLTAEAQDSIVARVQRIYGTFNVKVSKHEADFVNATYNRRTRIVVTESWEWYGQAGGVAYINSFGWGDNTPAFVFSSLLSYDVHNIGEAAAHEAGHTLGCRHQVTCADGVMTSQYNWGFGDWAPVMGASYNVTQGTLTIGPCSLGCAIEQNDWQKCNQYLSFKQ